MDLVIEKLVHFVKQLRFLSVFMEVSALSYISLLLFSPRHSAGL